MKPLAVIILCVFNLSTAYCQTVDLNRIIKIPVIFHIVYSDKTVRNFEKGQNPEQNLPIEALLCELKDLHDDFLLLNTDTSEVLANYKGRIANPRINFFLADTVLQSGGESGIVRVNTNKNKGRLYKQSEIVKPSKYLNVYIGDIPGSYLPSDKPWLLEDRDAVSLEYKWIGQGYRLLTHEVGHWCGLLHLWGTGKATGDSQSCLTGDDIGDTPAQREATDTEAVCESCPPPFGDEVDKSCVPNVPSNYNNFMDYSGCRKMFTTDQVSQMRENLSNYRKDIWAVE